MIMPNTDLVSQVVWFLSEYPAGYLIAILIGFSFVLSILWLSIGYIAYWLSSIGGDSDS